MADRVAPEDIRLVLKEDEEFAAWLPVTMREYEEARLEACDTVAQAEAARRDSEERFFPGGHPAEGHLVYTVLLGETPVGWYWIGPWGEADSRDWWVYDIRVFDEFQRRGIARIVMQEGERIARAHGASNLGLNAFAVNLPAITLYESLGYLTASLHMRKEL